MNITACRAKNDCVTTTLAGWFEVSYDSVTALLVANGHVEKGHGVYAPHWMSAVEYLFGRPPIVTRFPWTFRRANQMSGLLQVSNRNNTDLHLTCLVNGIVHETNGASYLIADYLDIGDRKVQAIIH